MAGVDLLRCDLHHCESADETLARDRGVRRARTPSSSGSSAAAGRWRTSPAARRRGRCSTRSCPTGPPSCPTATATARGSTRRALELAGIDARHARPGRRPDRARGRRHPAGTLHEGAAEPRRPAAAGSAGAGRAAGRPASSPRTTCSRSASPAGRTPPSARCSAQSDIAAGLPARRRSPGSSGPASSARCGGTASAAREQIPELVERRGVGRAAAGSGPPRVKIMQDGVAENFTAAMLEPYLDGCGCHTDNSGLSFVDPVGLREYVTRLDAAGFQVHFHALGDRAVREALDAVEAARAANGRDRRPPPPGAPAGRPPRRHARASPSSAPVRTCSRCGPPTSRRWTS